MTTAREPVTGGSAIVDALGRAPASDRLGLGRAGVIDAPLPPPLPPTLYERLGDAPFAVMLLLSLVSAVWASRRLRVSREALA